MKILAIHGVGHGDAKTDWKPQWQQAVAGGLGTWRPGLEPELEFLAYDDLFESAPLGAPEVLEALYRLSASGLFHGVSDRLRSRGGMASALDAMLRDPVQRDDAGRRAREAARRMASPEAVAGQTLEVYQRAIASRGRSVRDAGAVRSTAQ